MSASPPQVIKLLSSITDSLVTIAVWSPSLISRGIVAS